ncbi:MAG: hypothetical protein PUD15_00785 [Prevotella sp.]|nr:hypothetical protein [Prevotella sp.]
MGIRFTKKEDDAEEKDKTVQASEFIQRVTSMKQRKSEDKIKEIPWTEIEK